MRYSQLFGKTNKLVPKEAEIVSHKLLLQAGFIDQLASGVYSFLPLGYRVQKKLAQIIREEMDAIGSQELGMPVLQPKSLWTETGRWETFEPPLFKITDRHDKEFALGSTHEEVITDLVRTRVSSYRDLPLALYQIQTKFRNEQRFAGGLLRVREFLMKDLYSFHADTEDLMKFFDQVVGAYKKIFKRCGLEVIVTKAGGGTIGGSHTFEFNVISEVGENEIIYCPGGDFAENTEVSEVKEGKQCDAGHGELKKVKAIEVAHVFALGTKYSEAMNATFTDKTGGKKPIEMGCYGIGVGRVLATVVETSHDDKGIIWPKEIAPFGLHLIELGSGRGEDLYKLLKEKRVDVLYDDRDVPAGEKFADADLIGIPVRLVISEKTGEKVEVRKRNEQTSELQPIEEIISSFKE